MKIRPAVTIITTLIILLTINIVSASTADITPKNLPSQLNEGDIVTFNIKINIDSDADQNITIDTNLIPSDTTPLYDFGDLNPSITDNRFNQKIVIPKDIYNVPSTLQVKVSGKVPAGEYIIKPDNTNLIISRFIDSKLKFFEIHDKKLVRIETFDINIAKKSKFDTTMNSIKQPEFKNMKELVNGLFSEGLTSEAQSMATEMSNIVFPNSLSLVGLIDISDNTKLNLVFIIVIILMITIGFISGATWAGQTHGENYDNIDYRYKNEKKY